MNAFLLACIFIINMRPVFADDESGVQRERGSVLLSANMQSVSGLQTATLKSVSQYSEFIAYGKAVNIHPLLELRHRYLVAQAERGSARAKLTQAGQDIKRQQDLYREGATSKRNLQMQQAQWQADKARMKTSDVQEKAIIDEARLNWGEKLAGWALTTETDRLDALLSGAQTLLHITLPANKQLSADIHSIVVDVSGNRSSATKAQLISAAPQADNTAQGDSYFFQADAKHIRSGMRVAAWIPERGENQSGVIIPKTAVIWYMDQAFVYIKIAAEQFSRRAIDSFSVATGGYFVAQGIHEGERVVIAGGQMLLSEELKGQIPDEDD
ncbi:MAG: hypothetical protein Q8Q50_07500 [Methylobacter sp.]|nr:hypothetical protein [Methylobacter sp.]